MNLPFFLGDNFRREHATLRKRDEMRVNQFWDNVLTYDQTFGEHNLQVMVGTSFRDESFHMLEAAGSQFVDLSEKAWYLNLAGVKDEQSIKDDGLRQYGLSYFSRIAFCVVDN